VAVLGVCLAADDSVASLVDVISTKDQARLFKILEAAQPYEDVRTAYLIVRALQSLGFTEASKNVSFNTFLFLGEYSKINDIIYITDAE
jgi:hypothetical protein